MNRARLFFGGLFAVLSLSAAPVFASQPSYAGGQPSAPASYAGGQPSTEHDGYRESAPERAETKVEAKTEVKVEAKLTVPSGL